MGLIKEMLFTNNYHKITSVEYQVEKKQLRIRTEIFKDFESKRSLNIHREYCINENEIGKKMDSILKNINTKGIVSVAYGCLKLTKDFEGAIDN